MSLEFWYMFPIPMASGVGGQVGSSVARRLSGDNLERALGVLFILVAALTLGEAIF